MSKGFLDVTESMGTFCHCWRRHLHVHTHTHTNTNLNPKQGIQHKDIQWKGTQVEDVQYTPNPSILCNACINGQAPWKSLKGRLHWQRFAATKQPEVICFNKVIIELSIWRDKDHWRVQIRWPPMQIHRLSPANSSVLIVFSVNPF